VPNDDDDDECNRSVRQVLLTKPCMTQFSSNAFHFPSIRSKYFFNALFHTPSANILPTV
jgi:hypothetical protein